LWRGRGNLGGCKVHDRHGWVLVKMHQAKIKTGFFGALKSKIMVLLFSNLKRHHQEDPSFS